MCGAFSRLPTLREKPGRCCWRSEPLHSDVLQIPKARQRDGCGPLPRLRNVCSCKPHLGPWHLRNTTFVPGLYKAWDQLPRKSLLPLEGFQATHTAPSVGRPGSGTRRTFRSLGISTRPPLPSATGQPPCVCRSFQGLCPFLKSGSLHDRGTAANNSQFH